MNKIENNKILEVCYEEMLENGLQVMIIPKKNIQKKYIIWATKFGSIDNTFIDQETGNKVSVPDGIAHFLEHKMFEQKNGVDSLYKLMALGIDANAYTTNDHTAYLFECSDHFYEGLDELMDYVQNPYYTDQNVEKEKGIIGQEIRMYEDDPSWRLYINTMNCLYTNNPIKIDIAGTEESIAPINPEMLYTCYNNFYHPSNMVLVVVGDFEPEELLKEIKNRLLPKQKRGEIKRIYPDEPEIINKKEQKDVMGVSKPLFMIGIKDDISGTAVEKVRKHIAIEILLSMLVGKSSKLFAKLYDEGLLLSEPSMEYEFSKKYAHVLIAAQSKDPNKVYAEIMKEVEVMKQKGLDKEKFERAKKKIYGDYVVEYNDVADIGRMFASDYVKGINSFDYINEFDSVDEKFVMQILNNVFNSEKTAISIVE